jgi:hypothetical protein
MEYRSICTGEALVHSILISEVKDMKVMLYGHWKDLFLKKLWTFFVGSILIIFKKKNLHRLWISWCNISTIGIEKNLKAIPFFFFLLIYFVEE